MAHWMDRLDENAPGTFYVDRSCIDCDTCRAVAPAVFARSAAAERSYVHSQPADPEATDRALMALVACPTASIGTRPRLDPTRAAEAFPEQIGADLYYCGFAAESSFGASSYLIRRPDGNVLVDSPRASRPLMARIEALGGLSLMFLTHRDDVADHRAYQHRFGCRRVLHRDDVTGDTADVEIQLDGEDPIHLAPDLEAIPVPGHTAGSTALLYRDTALFTGDHLWWSPIQERLTASRAVCWYSWSEQLRSLRTLLNHRFEWVLPGHGRRYRAESAQAMRVEIERLIERHTREVGDSGSN